MDYGGFVGFKWKYLHTRKYILSSDREKACIKRYARICKICKRKREKKTQR